jgi:hypothetical protein
MSELEDWEEKALQTEDVGKLRDIITDLAMRVDELEEEREQVRVDPAQNQQLAYAVRAFAEWQTAGYEGGSSTRDVVSRALWYEVTKNVHAVFHCFTEDFGAHADWLDSSSSGTHVGELGTGLGQQTLFALT